MKKLISKNLNLFIIIFTGNIIFLLLVLKFFSFNVNYYDQIFYLQKFLKPYENIKLFLDNNFSVVFFLLSSIFFLLNFSYEIKILFLLFLNTVCILIPLFYARKNKNFIYLFFVYVGNPFFWYSSIHSFHPDVLALPLITYAIFNIEKNNKELFFFLLILIVLIKKVFFFISLGLLIFFIIKKKIKINYLIFFLFFITIYFLFTFYYFDLTISKSFFLLNKEHNYFLDIFNFLLTLILIYLSFHLYRDSDKYWIIVVPLLIFYFLYPSPNLKKYYYHYYILFLPIFLFYLSEFNFTSKIKKNILLFNSIILIVFSTSPFSLFFYFNQSFKFDNFLFNQNYKYLNDVFAYVNSLPKKHNNIIISNSIGNYNFLKDYNIDIFPNNINSNLDRIIILDSNNYYIYDQNCSKINVNQCSSENIDKLSEFLNSNFELIHKIDSYEIYVNN